MEESFSDIEEAGEAADLVQDVHTHLTEHCYPIIPYYLDQAPMGAYRSSLNLQGWALTWVSGRL